jgi:hypothetical protein
VVLSRQGAADSTVQASLAAVRAVSEAIGGDNVAAGLTTSATAPRLSKGKAAPAISAILAAVEVVSLDAIHG